MKLKIKSNTEGEEIMFSLVKDNLTGEVTLLAECNGTYKELLIFSPEGQVIRQTAANIGSFEFDSVGRLMIA